MQPPSLHVPKAPGWISEFKAFIARGNVIDLAVGIIIGAAFTGIVNSLVKDLFNPVLGLLIGGVDFSNLFFPLNGKHYDTLAAAQQAGAPTVNIGIFINACINFIIVAFAVFWLVKVVSKLMRKQADSAAAAPTTSELLLTEIRDMMSEHRAVASATLPRS